MILIVLKIDAFGFFIKIFQALHIYCNLEGVFSTVFRLDMANSDASSAPLNKTVRVLVSFFLAATDEASSARNTVAIHKEKLSVPLNELYRFQKHLKPSLG